jgi:hypothetical protein
MQNQINDFIRNTKAGIPRQKEKCVSVLQCAIAASKHVAMHGLQKGLGVESQQVVSRGAAWLGPAFVV